MLKVLATVISNNSYLALKALNEDITHSNFKKYNLSI